MYNELAGSLFASMRLWATQFLSKNYCGGGKSLETLLNWPDRDLNHISFVPEWNALLFDFTKTSRFFFLQSGFILYIQGFQNNYLTFQCFHFDQCGYSYEELVVQNLRRELHSSVTVRRFRKLKSCYYVIAIPSGWHPCPNPNCNARFWSKQR